MEIRAAVARAPNAPMSIESIQLAEPGEREVLVRMAAVGICHTDIVVRDQLIPGPQPIVLGHEGAGIVAATGSAISKVRPGDRVVLTFDSCGSCSHCLEGYASYCDESRERCFGGMRPDGTTGISKGDETIYGSFFGQSSFATHALAYERNVVKVGADAPLELLGPLACVIQTGAGAVINALKLGFGDTLAVFGAGSVGLGAVMAARAIGASAIIAIDRNRDRLQIAAELGATHVINTNAADVVSRVKSIVKGGVDFTIEATGVPELVKQAIACLDSRGVCGLIGSFPPGSTVPLDLFFMLAGGRGIRGIVEGDSKPDVFIPELIKLYQQGRFPFDRLITYYPFENINEAIEDCQAGKVIKPVLCFDSEKQL